MSAILSEADYTAVSCNACGSDAQQFRYQLQVSSIVTCEECGLSYVSPRINSAWIYQKLQQWAELDTVDQERLRIAFDDATLKLYQRYLQWLAGSRKPLPSAAPRPKLLDIGCSVGAFLTQAKIHYDASGLEIGKASAQYARDRCHIEINNASINDFDFSQQQYDVISLLEVIEHLEDPLGALKKIASGLHSEGQLLLTTPNFNSLYRRLFGAKWWVINCEDEHIYFFTKASLEKMLNTAGFDVQFTFFRGYDWMGMLKLALSKFKGNKLAQSDEPSAGQEDYFSSRNHKEKLKAFFNKIGLLNLVRKLLYAIDWLSSKRWSPLYGLGEQMIIIAKKR